MTAEAKQPSQLSDFKFIEQIGHGSFGTVHKVKRIADGSIYVIKQVKILAMSRKEQEAAINEVRILASLDSPYVIKYYDSFIDGDSLNIVMELAENGNLSQWLKRHRSKPVPEKLVWRFFIQLVAGMHHIHERNIVHRDLKALNIMLDKNDNIKIGDLGVAKVLTTHLRAAHTGVGTPYYLSPEVAQRRPYNAKSDVWALGCILYECCTRRHPFTGNTQAQLFQQIIRATYRPIPTQYSNDVHACVKACLTRSVEQRPSPLEIMLMPAFVAKAQEHGIEMPREVQLRLNGPSRAVPIAQPAAAPAGDNQETGTPGARRRAAQQGGVPQPEPEPEPEPEPRGPPRAELRPRPSSARPRPIATGAATGEDAAAQVVGGLHGARPRSAGREDSESRQRARQQQQAAARLANPLVPAVRRGQRRSVADFVDLPLPGGDIGLGLRGRRPASAGPARQRPSSAGPRYRAQAQPFTQPQDAAIARGGSRSGNGNGGYSGAAEPAARASGSGSPRASAGQLPKSAGTPRRAASSSGNDDGGDSSSADGMSAARAGATPSQAGSQQPQRSSAAEMMARRGISPGGLQQAQQRAQLQRPSSAPVRRSGSRDEAQRAADARRSAAVKSPGARDSVQEPSLRAGWVSARVNVSDATGNAAGGETHQQPRPAVSPDRMPQRRVLSNNIAAAHALPGSSPASHRIRQSNGFLRPASAGMVPSAQRRSATGGADARGSGSGRPTVQDLSGVRERLSAGRVSGGTRGSRPSSARLAQQRADAAAHQKAVDDVRSLPAY